MNIYERLTRGPSFDSYPPLPLVSQRVSAPRQLFMRLARSQKSLLCSDLEIDVYSEGVLSPPRALEHGAN